MSPAAKRVCTTSEIFVLKNIVSEVLGKPIGENERKEKKKFNNFTTTSNYCSCLLAVYTNIKYKTQNEPHTCPEGITFSFS